MIRGNGRGADMDHDDDRFQAKLVALQFKLGRWGWPIHGGVVACTAAFMLNDYILPHEVAWLSALGALSLILAVYCRFAPASGHRGYVLLTGIVGLVWGGSAIITAQFAIPTDLMFLTTVIGGTALGAVAIQHPLLSANKASLLTALPPLAFAHLWARGTQGAAMAAMIILFGGTLLLLARQMNRSLRKNITLLAERESLVEQLSEKVQELECATAQAEVARRAAESANDGKSRFLAQASHDLRQPLHAIGLFVECLKDQPFTPEADELIERIDASLENLSSLFTSLLDISMLDVGKIKKRPTTFAMQPMLKGLQDQFTEAASSRCISLTFVPCSLWAKDDRALLFRILQNIVSNAVKYAPGARVVVGCRRRGGTFDVEVHDSGPGIPGKDLELIFEEFTRGAVGVGDAPPGLGLGLAIVRRLAILLDLKAELSSVEGRGTVFRLQGLKAVPPRSLIRNVVHTAADDSLLSGLSALLVDDDPRVLAGTCSLLGRWGCRVTTAPSAEDALAGLKAMPHCDVLITDYDLGDGRNGMQLIRECRSAIAADLPAIVVSGLSASELRHQINDVGILLMNKPVRPAQLRSALMSVKVAPPPASVIA